MIGMKDKVKLFIADDERIIRESIRDYIDWDELGVQVVGIGKNGQDVLDYLSDNDIDILITDISMPEMDGMELLQRVSDLDSGTRIIFISAYSSFEYAHRALRNRIVDDYILKPIDPDSLVAAVKKSIQELERLSSIISFRELRPNELEWYSKAYFVSLKHEITDLVKQGNEQQAVDKLMHAADYVRQLNLSLNFFKRLSMDIFNSLNDNLLSVKHANGNMLAASDSLYRIISADQLEKLLVFMKSMIHEACTQLEQGHTQQMSYLICSAIEILGEKYLDSSFNLQALSNILSITPNYLSSKFKEETGIGFTKMLNQLRIANAKQLLAKGNYKIYEVANLSGIEDVRYFARLFREYTGQTPKEYRNFVLHGRVSPNIVSNNF